MKLEQAARQALEALEVSTDWDVGARGKQLQSMKAITALREALALYDSEAGIEQAELMEENISHHKSEQEPVAWILTEADGTMDFDCQPTIKPTQNDYDALREGETFTPLYAAPVRTKDLTYAELGELFVKAKEETFGYARVKPEGGISLKPSIEYFARAVIAADRGKNK